MSHTKAFLNHIEYQNFINGGEGKVCMPNVSVCEAEYEVHYNNDGTVDHVGIVESYDPDERKVYTLEGNSGDACKANVYNWNDQRIYGYGTYTLAKPFQNN